VVDKKPVKPKKCKVCKTEFMPFTSTAVVCGFKCAEEYAKRSRDRREASLKRTERVKTKKAIEAIQPKSYWLKKAQTVVNRYTRLRDKDEGCVSCDKPSTWQGQWHASHYRSVGSAPHLRFDERNVHKSCSVCNNHLSGNQINYRIRLVQKFGIEFVESLEADHKPKHFTVDDIKGIIETYKQKCKDMEKD
jgi:hypothetical protein